MYSSIRCTKFQERDNHWDKQLSSFWRRARWLSQSRGSSRGFVNHSLGIKTKGQFSIYYIDKGSKDPKSNFQIDLSYVESSFSLIHIHQGFSWEGGVIVGALVNGTTYDQFGYADANLSQFEQFDIGAKFAIGKEILPKLHFFWELSNTIPFFPIQNHPAYVSILNKGKMNSLLCFSFRYLLSEK